MIDPQTLAIIHDMIRRESRSFAQYLGDSLPWPQPDGAEVEEAIAPLVGEQRRALGELYRFLTRNHSALPYVGSYPSAFTTRNFISLHGLLPLLVDEERHMVAALGRDLSAIRDADASRIVSHFFEMKRAQLRRLEQLLNSQPKTATAVN